MVVSSEIIVEDHNLPLKYSSITYCVLSHSNFIAFKYLILWISSKSSRTFASAEYHVFGTIQIVFTSANIMHTGTNSFINFYRNIIVYNFLC